MTLPTAGRSGLAPGTNMQTNWLVEVPFLAGMEEAGSSKNRKGRFFHEPSKAVGSHCE